jgi:hypothetical protein
VDLFLLMLTSAVAGGFHLMRVPSTNPQLLLAILANSMVCAFFQDRSAKTRRSYQIGGMRVIRQVERRDGKHYTTATYRGLATLG